MIKAAILTMLVLIVLIPQVVHGQVDENKIQTGSLIEGTPIGAAAKTQNLGLFISGIYKVGVGAVAILAVIVIMWGGILWITAGGNTGMIDNAKNWISGAVLGLVLALTSYVILNTINPQLLSQQIEPPKAINSAGLVEKQFCCKDENDKIVGPFKTEFSTQCKLYNPAWENAECSGDSSCHLETSIPTPFNDCSNPDRFKESNPLRCGKESEGFTEFCCCSII